MPYGYRNPNQDSRPYLSREPARVQDHPAEVHWHQSCTRSFSHLGSSTPHTRGYRAADLPERQACKDAGRPGRGPRAPAAPSHSHTWAAAHLTLEVTGQQTYLGGKPARMLDDPAEVHWHQLHTLILTLGQQHTAHQWLQSSSIIYSS
jgi:hypothetical protein